MTTPTHSALTWPRSDGHKSRWPTDLRPSSASSSWHEPIPHNDAKYLLYEQKVAAYLAPRLKLPKSAVPRRMPLPEGYALFSHCKPQGNGAIRTDVYLFGSRHCQKFRSPAEFFEHADWLFDTTKPLQDHSKCGCKYNYLSDVAVAKKSSHISPSAMPKRVLEPSTTPKATKKARRDSSASSEEAPRGMNPDRAQDLLSQRRFRRGELVWFRIDDIPPKAERPGLPTITHWPGLIADIQTKTRVVNGINGSSSSSAGIAGYYEYYIRPLGCFSQKEPVVKDVKDLLPFAVGMELMGGPEGWDAIGAEGTQSVQDRAKLEREDEAANPQGVDERWAKSWGDKVSFSKVTPDWDQVYCRLGMALKMAGHVSQTWCQTDRIDITEDDDLNEEDKKAILRQEKSLYQGMWWGGERLWQDDMVRLKKNRLDLPSEHFPPPSPGAESRSVFFKIQAIAIVTAKTEIESDKIQWRCVLYGDLYELANKSVGPAEGAEKGRGSVAKVVLLNGESFPYKTPRGLEFRQLNSQGSEVTLDILDVAGRYYPDLDDMDTQNYFADRFRTAAENGNRVLPGETTESAIGLRSGTLQFTRAEKWREDLYKIVTEANREIEKQMKAYYASLLGIRKKPKKEKQEKQEKPDVDTKGTAQANGAKAAIPPTGANASGAADEKQVTSQAPETSAPMSVDGQNGVGSNNSAPTAPVDTTAEVTNDTPNADTDVPMTVPKEAAQPAASTTEASTVEPSTEDANTVSTSTANTSSETADGTAVAGTPPTTDQADEPMEVSQ